MVSSVQKDTLYAKTSSVGITSLTMQFETGEQVMPTPIVYQRRIFSFNLVRKPVSERCKTG